MLDCRQPACTRRRRLRRRWTRACRGRPAACLASVHADAGVSRACRRSPSPRAQGGWLTDTEGRTYLDGNASVWTNVHGHNDPDLNAALAAPARTRGAFDDARPHPSASGAELAAELAGWRRPGWSRVFFSDNGAGAVEVALKNVVPVLAAARPAGKARRHRPGRRLPRRHVRRDGGGRQRLFP